MFILPAIATILVLTERYRYTKKPAELTSFVRWGRSTVSTGPPIDGYIVTICPAEVIGGYEDEASKGCQKVRTSSEDTHVVLDGLKQFEEYEVTVRSFVKSGSREVEGHPARIAVTTNPPPIPKVVGLKITSLNSSSSAVSWSKTEGFEDFSVVYNVTVYLNGDRNVVLWREVNETQTILTGLSDWTNYTIRVYVCLAQARRWQCGDFSEADFQTPAKGE